MLTAVEITNAQDVTLSLPLDDVSGGYEVRDIDGLDPVDAEISSSSFANMDGEEEGSSRRGKRHITFKLGYALANIRDLRKNLYKFFIPKSTITMRFYLEEVDMFYVEITGTVESFKSPIFAKDPEATIVVQCFDPEFSDPEPTPWSGATTTFDTQALLTYDGDVETGFKLSIAVDRAVTALTIHHRTTATGAKNFLIFNTTGLAAGDTLLISTIPGDKYIRRVRAGVTSSLLYGLDSAAIWTMLYPGTNYIKVSVGGSPLPYTIEYTNLYGGL